MPLDVLEDQMSQNWIMGTFTGNLLMYRKKNRGLSHMFPLPNPKMANEPWHMLVSVMIAPASTLQTYSWKV